ncbi:MAG: gamma-butyrobetaine hydroxylase-like domain-containing protein [Planctomycetota bacterium]
MEAPTHIDVKRDKGVTVEWPDGKTTFYSVPYLRKWSPSADQREIREQMESNPLAVLPSSAFMQNDQSLTITDAKLIGNYAIAFEFSDGHSTGIYSWEYLREIDPEVQERMRQAERDAAAAANADTEDHEKKESD